MKRNWEVYELVEHFTLLPAEISLLGNKSGANRLGFALLLKFFQVEARFPRSAQEVPLAVVTYIANQLGIPPELYHEYDWNGRNIKYHRVKIRSHLGFHQATVTDIREMIDWLCSGVPEHNYKVEHLTTNAISRFRELKIEPPTPEQVERLVRSAIHSYEERFFSATFSKLPLDTIREIDVLLGDSISVAEGTEVGNDAEQLGQSDFSTLKTDPGRIGLESILKEMTKLQRVRQLNLPVDLFSNISPKLLEQYRQRVATEPLRELRRHPAPIRYTLMAVFGWLRTQEITDNLVELLIQIVHGISARAQQRVEKELLSDFKRVSGKTGLLFQLAEAALDHPEGIVKNVLYPVVGEQTLKDLVKEFNSSGTAYRQKVHTIVRSSYSNHYRRMMTPLLEILEFRSNNEVHRPVIQALELLKKYAGSSQRYYAPEEEVQIEGVLRSGWREILLEQDSDGKERINRINYEISVLQALRERLRCKEIWVVGASRYRNPDQDLPTDFEQQRETYYQALNQPIDAEAFITRLQVEMTQSLAELDKNLPHNSQVKLLKKGNGWISLSPFDAQPEPINLARLKAEVGLRWPCTSLLDILKETDLRVGFTRQFRSAGTRENLEREILQKRLLLCLYGLGTNTGVKRLSAGIHGESYHDLLYVRRRFINIAFIELVRYN